MNNYRVEYYDLPVSVKAFTVKSSDDTFIIFINSRLSYEQQQKSFKHELRHIKNDDFQKQNVDEIECMAHY